jgi:microcystin degradation protein MlrC
VYAISDGHFQAHGPMGGGVWRHVGLTVVVQVRGIAVVLSSSNQQANDLAQFTSLGLNPAACATVALKSMQHFKAAFSPIAREILNLDSGGLCTRSYHLRPYQRVRRPIYPLDEGTTWIKPNTPTV